MKWKKGQSGNPGGRPAVIAEVTALAREHTNVAINTLIAIAKNTEQPAAARVSAAIAILDRGYGKPPQMVTTNATASRPAAELSDDELAAICAGVDDEDDSPAAAHKSSSTEH